MQQCWTAISHAPAKESDIEISYGNKINLLVEATLLRDKAGQKNSETSSIIRRTLKFQAKTKLTTYAILVAPHIHEDTYLYFKCLVRNDVIDLGECYAFPLSIKRFLEYFVEDTQKSFKEILEDKFETFKKVVKVDELDKFVN